MDEGPVSHSTWPTAAHGNTTEGLGGRDRAVQQTFYGAREGMWVGFVRRHLSVAGSTQRPGISWLHVAALTTQDRHSSSADPACRELLRRLPLRCSICRCLVTEPHIASRTGPSNELVHGGRWPGAPRTLSSTARVVTVSQSGSSGVRGRGRWPVTRSLSPGPLHGWSKSKTSRFVRAIGGPSRRGVRGDSQVTIRLTSDCSCRSRNARGAVRRRSRALQSGA